MQVSSPTLEQSAQAQTQANDIMLDAAKGRVAVHTFDPDASPQEKAAAAGKGRENLKSVADKTDAGERSIAVDTGHSTIVPTISIDDIDALPTSQVNEKQSTRSTQSIQSPGPSVQSPTELNSPLSPGAMPHGPASTIPDWYKVGWRSVSGIDAPQLEEGEERDKGVLDVFLAEQFYGDWYHNAGLIFFVVFATHFLSRFQAGFGWLFIILAFANTYYSTSVARFRRRARDDIQRNLVKTRLLSESESAEWMNHFMDRFWLIYEPILSQTVISSVDQILSANTPPFLDSLRLSTFTLGTKAPRIDKVHTHPKTPDDLVEMDWSLSFTPNDESDLTPRQLLLKVNPKIVLSVRVGKGLATASMPILLENITFAATMKIKLKLMTNFPHVQTVRFCFLEPPVIDYVLKPIGGDAFGFDINHIPGLSAFISGLTHATLGPMMYHPNEFTLNLEQLLTGTPLDSAIGVLQLTIQSARGIKGTKVGGGTPDPYVTISINERAQLDRTRCKRNTYNPTWMETKFILIQNIMETLVLSTYDFNDHRKDTLLGNATFELSALAEDAKHENLMRPILRDGKERGELRFDVSYYPVLKPEAGTGEEVMDSTVGIVRLTIHQAKELDASKSLSGDLNPFAKVYVGGSNKAIHHTPRFKHTINPVWESSKEYLCSDRASAVVTIHVIDDRDFLRDPVVGHISVKLDDLLEAKREAAGRDWWPLSGCKSGKIRLGVEWKPLNMAGSLHGANQYVPPIGVVRLHLVKGEDLKNVEAAMGGKSDPYVRVLVNSVIKGRTEVVNNNLNPVWDEIIYIPVHSLRESILLECMDYQNLSKDRSLGSTELRVSQLAKNTGDPKNPYESTGKKLAQEPLQQDQANVQKGILHYVAEFVPVMHLKFAKFERDENEMELSGGRNGDDMGSVSDDRSSKTEDSDHPILSGVTVKAPLGPSSRAVPAKSKSVDSTMTTDTAESKKTASNKADDAKPVEEEEVQMSKEELLQHQSGIIVFNVVSGELHKKARLQVLLNDAYWPMFSTVRAPSMHAKWNHVGEAFLKEMDFGRVWLRLNEHDSDQKEDIIAEWKGDVKSFLEETLDGVKTFTLVGPDLKESIVSIECRYIPVPIKLDERETISNQGLLRVDLIDAQDILAADRGGKSDPYAAFTLNGQKVFKSQTKKKTLNPEWNERFEVPVHSRVAAEFLIELFDWNQIEQAKSLGSAQIPLTSLEPLQASELRLSLRHPKHGDKGYINIRLLFQPEILVKTRKNTHTTFQSAGKTMTHIGTLPMNAGKGVLQGVTGVFKKEKDFAKVANGDDPPPVPDLPTGTAQASMPVGQSNGLTAGLGAVFPSLRVASEDGGRPAAPGILRLTVLDAKDLTYHDVKPYVTVRVGDKESKTKPAAKTERPEWNESFTFSAGVLTPKLFVWVYDHKTLGKDRLLGDGEAEIWRHIQPDKTSSADVVVELRNGQGLLHLRLEFDADASSSTPALPRRASKSSLDRSSTIGGTMRFSLRGRKNADAGKA